MFQSTPPRGRRPTPSRYPCRSRRFNPRLREGGDLSNSGIQLPVPGFNPRLREGGDPQGRGDHHQVASFNPRLREGGDPRLSSDNTLLSFQSTPPRGRRRITVRRAIAGYMFQSTPPRGRRRTGGDDLMVRPSFNPRLREGGDWSCCRSWGSNRGFNPRLREGGDCIYRYHV